MKTPVFDGLLLAGFYRLIESACKNLHATFIAKLRFPIMRVINFMERHIFGQDRFAQKIPSQYDQQFAFRRPIGYLNNTIAC